MDQKVEVHIEVDFEVDQISNAIQHNLKGLESIRIEEPIDNDNDAFTKINVSIQDTQTREETVGKYVVYVIRGGDRNGDFEVTRRFNDFHIFRQSLITRWPGCFVPPIPQKQAVGNLDEKFIRRRLLQLNDFMNQLSSYQILWYSEESHTFFHSDLVDLEKHYTTLPRQTNEEIIRKYEINFKNLAGLDINLQLMNTISNFQQFLKHVSPMLGNFKDIYRNLQKARDTHNDQYMTFLTYLLPEYEKTCLQEYQGGVLQNSIFSDKDSVELKGLLNRLKTFFEKNEFSQLLSAIKLEQREIAAFNEVIQQRDLFENQKIQAQQKLKQLQLELQEIIAGKTTLKKIFSQTPKEEQIARYQIKIDVQNKEIDQLLFLCDIITVMLGYVEIVRFRKEKEQAYFKMIRQIAEFELEFSKIQSQFWEFILQNKSIYT